MLIFKNRVTLNLYNNIYNTKTSLLWITVVLMSIFYLPSLKILEEEKTKLLDMQVHKLQTRWIKVRVSETEKSVIDEKSRLAGVTTAALIRESF